MSSASAQDEKSGEKSYEFQAEVARLLDLMVHSVYSEREVFLRELVSNAADALDKLRYEALTNASLLAKDDELAITLKADLDAKTLTLIDNGIGMSHDELVKNLGTIARSGTKAFVDQINKDSDKKSGPDLIGQFGIGFYAAFMVADRVDVISQKAGSNESWQWTSDGKGAFDLTRVEEDAGRGTRITLHIKKDATEFLEEQRLRHIIHTYSDHISFPIFLDQPEAESLEKQEGEEATEAEKTQDSRQQLNAANALWARPKSEISTEQYKEFYHHAGGVYDDPAITLHYTAEGRQLYTSLLFVPSSPPFDLFDADRKSKVKLYVKRVFITDDAQIMPSYLRFVRGIVDSDDIPLNLSREMLQNNPLLEAIRKAVTNKVLAELTRCAEKDGEKYLTLWENFGAVLKEGLYEDPGRRDTLYKLARFRTSLNPPTDDMSEDTSKSGWRSLDDYIADMPEKQKAIYYLTGDSMEQLKASPQLEGYLARGLEVLLMADPVDSFWITSAPGYNEKLFTSITQGGADLDEIPTIEGTKEEKTDDNAPAAVLEKLKTVLADEVMDVKTSSRLVGSPACLIASSQAPDRQLEKLMAMQKGGLSMPGLNPILEINASHGLIKSLNNAICTKNEEKFNDLAFLLLDEARILEGGTPSDPAKFTERLNRLLLHED